MSVTKEDNTMTLDGMEPRLLNPESGFLALWPRQMHDDIIYK